MTWTLIIHLACAANLPCPGISFGGFQSIDECRLTAEMGVYRHALVSRDKLEYSCKVQANGPASHT